MGPRLHISVWRRSWTSYYVRLVYSALLAARPDGIHRWGQSAGSISVAMQLLAYDGNSHGLFHGAFMQSGAVIPVGSILKGQGQFDELVSAVGCDGAVDKLECLRAVELADLQPIVDATNAIFSEKVASSSCSCALSNSSALQPFFSRFAFPGILVLMGCS